MMKVVLVTGGFGYVGSRLVPHLIDQGYHVKVLDLCLYGAEGLEALTPAQREKLTLIREDLRDPRAVHAAVKDAEAVIHLAAISNDPTGNIDEILTRQVNFDAVGLLVKAAKEAGVRRFINASSSSVFGKKGGSSIDETLEPEPLTFYSKYKMLSEWIVNAAASPDFCTVNIRPATICGYSPRQRFDLTVNRLTIDGLRKGIITVHGGEQRRPNVGISDMIDLYAFLLTVDSKLINGETFNFGFENLKIIDIAKLIQNSLQPQPQIHIEPIVDQRDYHISAAKILRALPFKPSYSIQHEVEQLKIAESRGLFGDPDESRYNNMKSMRLERSSLVYEGCAN